MTDDAALREALRAWYGSTQQWRQRDLDAMRAAIDAYLATRGDARQENAKALREKIARLEAELAAAKERERELREIQDAYVAAMREAVLAGCTGMSLAEAMAKLRTERDADEQATRRAALEEVIAMADKIAAGHRAMAQKLVATGQIPEGNALADVPAKTIEAFRDNAVRALIDKEPQS